MVKLESADRLASEARPRIQHAVDQVSDTANDLYGRASEWLGEGDRRTYVTIAVVVSVGALGFFLGRALRGRSQDA